jgi:hypothetical protein
MKLCEIVRKNLTEKPGEVQQQLYTLCKKKSNRKNGRSITTVVCIIIQTTTINQTNE